ncbi:MAG TPA: response regulator transcription factor [Candidatus Limnocylindria bacterium]|jgi:serine/threonine-protein kinase|nr:response regulator transcription factor [Candidatus Limnocylindria bacterium]
MSVAPLRVVIADDSVLFREGLARLLSDEGVEVAAEVGDAAALAESVARLRPDVAIIDIRMPPTRTREGFEVARLIRAEHASTAVLLLSSHVEVADAMDVLALSAGGIGYLLKDSVSDVHELISTLRRVAAGGSAIDPTIVVELIGHQRRTDPLDALTPREREVLALMAEGRSNAGISGALFVTEGAVEKYVRSILAKLEIPVTTEDHRRVLAVLAFLDSR